MQFKRALPVAELLQVRVFDDLAARVLGDLNLSVAVPIVEVLDGLVGHDDATLHRENAAQDGQRRLCAR